MRENKVDLDDRLKLENYFPPFFSILLPELGRPQYLMKCLESIMLHADLPIETIVHDDGSGDANQRIIFNSMKKQISTLIFNTYFNTGLGVSMNRCRSMASSHYMLAMNTDQQWTSSFLQNMKAALDLPYIGIVNVVPKIGLNPDGSTPTGVHITPDGIKIALQTGTGQSLLFGIRRNVWDEAGGWGENIQTTASDGGFIGNVFGRGYFSAVVEGTHTNEQWAVSKNGKVNIGGANPHYVSSSRYTRNDNNIPRIFKMAEHLHEWNSNRRREEIWYELNDNIERQHLYPTWYNSHYSCRQMERAFKDGDLNKIDWIFLERYGHDKWKDRVIKDFNLEKGIDEDN